MDTPLTLSSRPQEAYQKMSTVSWLTRLLRGNRQGTIERKSLSTPQKPADLMYGVDERPPLSVMLLGGLQHILAMTSFLVVPVIIASAADGSAALASDLVRLSMVAGGIGTILQALPRSPVGSGYLCPFVTGSTYLPASILAVKTGGLALMYGMTLAAASSSSSSLASSIGCACCCRPKSPG